MIKLINIFIKYKIYMSLKNYIFQNLIENILIIKINISIFKLKFNYNLLYLKIQMINLLNKL